MLSTPTSYLFLFSPPPVCFFTPFSPQKIWFELKIWYHLCSMVRMLSRFLWSVIQLKGYVYYEHVSKFRIYGIECRWMKYARSLSLISHTPALSKSQSPSFESPASDVEHSRDHSVPKRSINNNRGKRKMGWGQRSCSIQSRLVSAHWCILWATWNSGMTLDCYIIYR